MQTRSLFYFILLISAAQASPDLFPKVKEILSQRCLSCHNSDSKLLNGGNLSLETYEDIIKGGNKGTALVPNDPDASPLYKSLTHPESNQAAMPPPGRFARLPAAEIATIKKWIETGAVWPNGEKVHYKKATPTGNVIDPVEMKLVTQIREKILAASAEIDPSKSYSDRIDGVRMKLKMMPIPAGSFRFQGDNPDDMITAHIDPFWMAETEIAWDLYQPFMNPIILRNKDGYPQDETQVKNEDIMLAQPSRPYHAMSFGMGVRRHPAIAMTHHAANKFCQWLSWQTGHFYRLPTEAEWEYAARAGISDDSPEGVAAFAWYDENSNGSYQRIGKKETNAWGLHDMLGNVMEWTLDGYVENRRSALGGNDEETNPWVRASGPYPHVCKGGHWNSDISELTFSGRTPSSPQWKISDPQTPKSIWYHTSIMWIGFRPVRPVEVPSAEEMYRYWNSGVAYD